MEKIQQDTHQEKQPAGQHEVFTGNWIHSVKVSCHRQSSRKIIVHFSMQTAAAYIQHYGLLPHPEGGWYRETYKSAGSIPAAALPAGFSGARPFSTAIYFLLEAGNFSAFHRIRSDECWHFYAGDPLEVFILQANGQLEIIRLGREVENQECFQFVVPANCWFASRPAAGSAYSFVGCTVAPGFDFADFELARAEELAKQFPAHKELIRSLCRI